MSINKKTNTLILQYSHKLKLIKNGYKNLLSRELIIFIDSKSLEESKFFLCNRKLSTPALIPEIQSEILSPIKMASLASQL